MPPERPPTNAAQPPPLFTATPESLIQDTKRLIEQSRKLQNEVVRTVQPETATFANTLLPLAQNENRAALESHVIKLYQNVSPDPALRDASNEAKKLFGDFGIQTAMREDMFVFIDAVLRNSQDENLDIESQWFLEKEHKKYLLNGLGILGFPEREAFENTRKQLSELSVEFQRNLNEEISGIWFEPEELEGISRDVLERLEKGQDDTPNKDKLRLTFQYPDYIPTMSYAKNSETHRKVFLGYENKCNQNVPLFKETIVLRDKAARLLDYPDHATFRLEDKMIRSPQTVNSFLDDLRSRLALRGSEEIEKLKQLKKADLGAEKYDGHYYLWDHHFYHQMMLEQQFSVDQQKIAEYFPLRTVVQAMVGIFEDLFGLVFSTATGGNSNHTWHEDVQLLSVWDDEAEGGEFVGYLYLDFYPRQGKFSHAANFNMQPVRVLPKAVVSNTHYLCLGGFSMKMEIEDIPRQLWCATSQHLHLTKSSLLKHDELVMQFHELGHGIHDLVSKTTYSRFHGTMTVQDFCEALSQMLENWCWTPSLLQNLSRHCFTGEKIPEDIIGHLIRSKNVNSGLFYLRQLHISIFDMMIHQPASHGAIEKTDSSKLYNSLWEEITRLEGPNMPGGHSHEWGHGEATFSHLMGDYDAGYYGYLISKVFALDMFDEAFKLDPMNAKEGRRYRQTVLEKGGSQPEMRTLVEFLGQQPKTDAFYKALGLDEEMVV